MLIVAVLEFEVTLCPQSHEVFTLIPSPGIWNPGLLTALEPGYTTLLSEYLTPMKPHAGLRPVGFDFVKSASYGKPVISKFLSAETVR